MVDAVVTDPLNQTVLDPACGSGSFIFAAVRKYLTAAQEADRTPSQQVQGLLNHVFGVDVHPVAVHLARATWTLAARDALNAARDARLSVTVPVYLGDSLQLSQMRTRTGDMFGEHAVTIPVPNPLDAVQAQNRELEFPRAFVEDAGWFDGLLTSMASAVEGGQDPKWALDDHGVEDGPNRRMLERTANLLLKLHDEGRDHIWAYYARNLVRPVALRAEQVDIIVGNPPWITYNKSEAVLREELVRQSRERYGIWQGRHYATHQDIAGLFYCRSVELYLRPGGMAAMVLPHSALQAGQYSKWRDGRWGVLSVDLSVRRPWDLERIEPNDFFPVPASVVFLTRKDPPGKQLPSQAERWRGQRSGPFTVEQVPLMDTSGAFASPYGERARQGATIVPRALFFVNVEPSKARVQAANIHQVSPRRSNQEKSPWKELELNELANQAIEAEHVFDVYLGETIAPYLLLDPVKAVLPLSMLDGQLTEPEEDDDDWFGIDALHLGERMRGRWRAINELWDEYKNRDNKLSLLERIDYMGNLDAQPWGSPQASLRVAYSSSGRPTAAVVRDPDVLIDYTLFWIRCSSEDEANYLCAIINSRTLERMLEPLMPKGQFGARHVQKHLWRLPIPGFDESIEVHKEIALAGKVAAEGAVAAWEQSKAERAKNNKSTGWRAARTDIREWLLVSDEGRRVEELVAELLG